MLQRDPKNVPALLVKARFLLAERRSTRRSRRPGRHGGRSRVHSGALSRRDDSSAARNERDKAIAAFNEVLKLNPQASAAQFQLAQLNLARARSTRRWRSPSDAARAAPGDADVAVDAGAQLAREAADCQAEAHRAAPGCELPEAAAAHSLAGAVALAEARLCRAPATHSARRSNSAPDELEPVSGLVTLELLPRTPDDAGPRVEARLPRSPDSLAVLLGGRRCGRPRASLTRPKNC